MERLFVYGTLKEPAVRKKVLGKVIEGTPDILPGFKVGTLKIEGRTYPAALPAKGAAIRGLVLELDEVDIVKTDKYETRSYHRTEEVLYSGKKAWVYQSGLKNARGVSRSRI